MDIGIFAVLTDRTIDPARLATRVEALDFESLWLPDHIIMPAQTGSQTPGGGRPAESYRRMGDPLVLLAVAAGVTTRLKLGTGVLVLPLRHPLVTAKAIATLDRASGGRVKLGIGCGWVREEAEIFGIDFDTRWARARDHALAMRVCWSHEVAGYEGRFVQFPALYSEPAPVQEPGPPMIVASDGEAALERVADFGDGWMAHAARTPPEALATGRERLAGLLAERGRDPADCEITVFACPPDPETLRAYAEAGAQRAVLQVKEQPGEATEAQLEEWARALL